MRLAYRFGRLALIHSYRSLGKSACPYDACPWWVGLGLLIVVSSIGVLAGRYLCSRWGSRVTAILSESKGRVGVVVTLVRGFFRGSCWLGRWLRFWLRQLGQYFGWLRRQPLYRVPWYLFGVPVAAFVVLGPLVLVRYIMLLAKYCSEV